LSDRLGVGGSRGDQDTRRTGAVPRREGSPFQVHQASAARPQSLGVARWKSRWIAPACNVTVEVWQPPAPPRRRGPQRHWPRPRAGRLLRRLL